MLTKKLKDIFKISSRYKSQNFLYFAKRKNFTPKTIPLISFPFATMADQGKRTKETTGESIPESKQSQKIGGPFTITPNPAYIGERVKIYDELIQVQKKTLATVNKRPIQITLKDGKVLDGTSFETAPIDIAKKISKKLAENVIVLPQKSMLRC